MSSLKLLIDVQTFSYIILYRNSSPVESTSFYCSSDHMHRSNPIDPIVDVLLKWVFAEQTKNESLPLPTNVFPVDMLLL